MRPGKISSAWSLPVRGAWIEIIPGRDVVWIRPSLPVRGAWIEIDEGNPAVEISTSLPVRGAWIEIGNIIFNDLKDIVAPRKGSVD